MKRIKVLSFMVALACIACAIFYSCTKGEQTCKDCTTKQADHNNFLKLGAKETYFKFWKGGTASENDQNYAIGLSGNVVFSVQELSNWLNLYSVGLSGYGVDPNSVINCVLYSNSDYTGSPVTLKENILGFLIYYKDGDNIKSIVLNKRNDKFEELIPLRSTSNKIFFIDIFDIHKILVKKQPLINNNKISALCLYTNKINDNDVKDILNKSNSDLGRHIRLYNNGNRAYLLSQKVKLIMAGDLPGEPTMKKRDGCKAFLCNVAGGAACEGSSAKDAICYPSSCSAEKTAGFVSSISNALPAIRAFENHKLAGTSWGQSLIEDYYYCGYVLKDKINLHVAERTATIIFNKIIPIIDKLNSTSADTDNTILINNADAIEIISYISYIKQLSDDTTFKNIMNETIANIEYIKGKSTNEVNTLITH